MVTWLWKWALSSQTLYLEMIKKKKKNSSQGFSNRVCCQRTVLWFQWLSLKYLCTKIKQSVGGLFWGFTFFTSVFKTFLEIIIYIINSYNIYFTFYLHGKKKFHVSLQRESWPPESSCCAHHKIQDVSFVQMPVSWDTHKLCYQQSLFIFKSAKDSLGLYTAISLLWILLNKKQD